MGTCLSGSPSRTATCTPGNPASGCHLISSGRTAAKPAGGGSCPPGNARVMVNFAVTPANFKASSRLSNACMDTMTSPWNVYTSASRTSCHSALPRRRNRAWTKTTTLSPGGINSSGLLRPSSHPARELARYNHVFRTAIWSVSTWKFGRLDPLHTGIHRHYGGGHVATVERLVSVFEDPESILLN